MKETQHIEFKSNFSDEVIETLTAFANTKGGKVLVGVANNGEPLKKFTIGVEAIQEWLNTIKTKTQPSIIPDAEVVKIKGVDVVELSVQEFPVKPVGCRGRYFKRVKNSNQQLSPSMIIDDKMLRLSLFDAVEETQKYLMSQMKVAFEITGETTQRTEILEYPKPAIRELILNGLIHRDYSSPIDVQIKVFDDYITFYNPGKLYCNLTVEDLQTNNYHANARNKLIAEAFYLTGDIEKYGSGFRRIRNELKQYPTMKLDCEEVPNGFLATISYAERKTSLNIQSENVTDNQTVEETVGTVGKIITFIKENPQITQTELMQATGLSRRGIEWNIAQLKEKGIIKREGHNKGSYWKILMK